MSKVMEPCPFCGGEAEVSAWPTLYGRKYVYSGTVLCRDCGANVTVADVVTKDQARDDVIRRWNTRTAVTETDFSRAVHDGELWEKRRTCRLVKDDCYWRGTECRDMFLTKLDIKLKYRYCPSCGAKVVG